jgi:acyl carrier protein
MKLTDQDLLAYLRDEIGVETDGIDRATPLVTSGIIDSFSLVEFVAFIEHRAGIRFGAADATIENLDSIDRILSLVERAASDDGP